MNKNIDRKNRAMMIQTIRRVSVSLLILGVLSSCAEESRLDNGSTVVEGGHTVTLKIIPTVVPISETKATVRAASPDSEAAAAGFSYELVSSDHTDSTATELSSVPVTKAPPEKLKNVYALLFTSSGAFNGRASVGTISASEALYIKFTDVASPTAKGCRLVIVANDDKAGKSYSSSAGTGGFGSFTGTYAQFQALTMTNTIAADADIPYAGTETVNLMGNSSNAEVSNYVIVSLYRTLASITLKNEFKVTGSNPALARVRVELHNAGTKRFAPVGIDDKYDGSANTVTPGANLVASPSAANANSVNDFFFYIGENVRPAGGNNIVIPSDRDTSKAPLKSSYIRITSNAVVVPDPDLPPKNLNIGEEYLLSKRQQYTYDIYLGKSSNVKDFSLRRNTNYTINSSVTGTIEHQDVLDVIDGRVTKAVVGGISAGLVIARFGGATNYTRGASDATTVSGSYQKLLLLEPNGETGSVARKWSNNMTNIWQQEARKFWDHTYTLANIDKAQGLAYDYCNKLTLGRVAPGTWYLPTQAQLMLIWAIQNGLKDNGYAKYVGLGENPQKFYWSSTENISDYSKNLAWVVSFTSKEGNTIDRPGTDNNLVRCVRDL